MKNKSYNEQLKKKKPNGLHDLLYIVVVVIVDTVFMLNYSIDSRRGIEQKKKKIVSTFSKLQNVINVIYLL